MTDVTDSDAICSDTLVPATPRAYEIDGQTVDAAAFIAAACDPAASVVVEACAGSGKTWLLVARMLRLLLEGCAPSALLAITFTRKAAQEMQERLMLLLRELALAPDVEIARLLGERGVAAADITRLLPVARGLYERILSTSQRLSIDTFHSWFGRLLQVAPLASGVPHGYSLIEATGELLLETNNRFMRAINEPDHKAIHEALLALYKLVGDHQAQKLLDAFVAKRAEWWAVAKDGAPLESLRALCGDDASNDARLSLWCKPDLCERISRIAHLLGKGTATNQKRATAIDTALDGQALLDKFDALYAQFLDSAGAPRKNLVTKGLLAALEHEFGNDAVTRFETEFNDLGLELSQLQARSHERSVIALNQALTTVGHAFLEQYQTLKAERRVFDFADLEWHVYRLLNNPQHAAYLQSRLDARYRHVLLDEFQDTNPLQWSVVRAWLDAYGDGAGRPSVFVVGDPKQSIYRFRRAEPRVFEAAREMLQAQGARVLRTSQTRRNAPALTAVFNQIFHSNPLYFAQTTLAAEAGVVWRLPLARRADPVTEPATLAPSSRMPLRDPLNVALEEEEDARRLEEGIVVAQAILAARAELDASATEGSAPSRWSDVMLLVKKRAHLGAYERALREAGIPYTSSKRGGLLESLEVRDLTALLRFLITPGDNLSLAQVLKSPIFCLADDDLAMLARRPEATWWLRLQCAAQALPVATHLQHAVRLLATWRNAAPRLPVHDLLDIMLDEGQIVARYAQAAKPLERAQVIGNLHAFTELSLSLDAGRYPSLPKFIDALCALQGNATQDAPDEAAINAGLDAVRIMTIHSAKGLEAPIVVVLDANHSEPAREDAGVLCVWPQHAPAPVHFSVFGRKAERGMARLAFFQEEEKLKAQEDWNLLYVATTRAKQILIVSGVAGRNTAADGVVADSWYARMANIAPREIQPAGQCASPVRESTFSLPLFQGRAPVPTTGSLPPIFGLAPPLSRPDAVQQAADEGILLHALMERVTAPSCWPVRVPPPDIAARWLDCTLADAAVSCRHALCILSQASLRRFFDPSFFHNAENELDMMADGELMRMDRVVWFAGEIWILDYKRSVGPADLDIYGLQLSRYRKVLQRVMPDQVIRIALIGFDGRLWQLD